MTPEEVLSIKPRILTQKQREFYFENGYLLLEKFLLLELLDLKTTIPFFQFFLFQKNGNVL